LFPGFKGTQRQESNIKFELFATSTKENAIEKSLGGHSKSPSW
jgi:hypothetical protein